MSGPVPADKWGPLAIPALAPTAGQAPGDPALTYLLGFLKAFLQDDANVTAAWTLAGVAPTLPIVKSAFAHDPNEGAFNEASLPALYGRRSEMLPPEQIADGIRTRVSTITLLWVFPPATQATQAVRRPIMNAIAHAVDLAVERGRTPSFVVPGDTDPNATLLGSNVWTWMAFWQLRMGAARPAKVDVPVKTAKGIETNRYDALQITLSLEEDLSIDMRRYDALKGLDLRLENDAGDVLAEDLIPPV